MPSERRPTPADILATRSEEATERARSLLGDAAPSRDSPPGAFIDALVGALAATGRESVHAEQKAHMQRLEHTGESTQRRQDAFDQMHAAVDRLARLTTPGDMLAGAARELCSVAGIRRVVLSSVRGGVLVPETSEFAEGEAEAPALDGTSVRLVHRLVETDVVRRRRAALVERAGVGVVTDRRLDALMGWHGYVVAPVVVGATAIALVHADRGPAQPAEEMDRDVVAEFATELARTYESASLRRSLLHEREEMRRFFEWLNARSRELASGPITLDDTTLAPLLDPHPVASTPGTSDIVVFDGVLTRRELEVLRLLSDGYTNRAIADELVVAAGTVKSHVNRILAKLHVANRAEAVARYYGLMATKRRNGGADGP